MIFEPYIFLGKLKSAQYKSCAPDLRKEVGFLFLASTIFFLTCLYRIHASARDPTSLFFSSSKGYQRRYSIKREQEAIAHIATSNLTIKYTESPLDPLLCIAIPTSASQHEHYLKTTVGSLLEGLTESERGSIYMVVLITEPDPENRAVYTKPWLADAVNSVIQYNISDSESQRLGELTRKGKTGEKSAFDYEYLLRDCMESGAKWIMTTEADVVAVADWYTRAQSSLQTLNRHTSNDRHWLYLRLFYTEKLMGWNRENWLTYLFWSCLSFALLLVTLICLRCSPWRFRKSFNTLRIVAICCIFLPAAILLYFAAGKISMQPFPRGLQRMESFACCAQGFIYPRKMVPLVIEKIQATREGIGSLNEYLERWADKEHWARFALIPPLLQHIGVESGKGFPDIWNFAFEDYD